MWYRASAPGSMMLMGEYAVLHEGHALVAAIDKRVTVNVQPRGDKKIFITSALGKYSCDLSPIIIETPFEFVLTAIKQFSNKLVTGFELNIESDFLPTLGLGSSAAVTTATIAALDFWLGCASTQEQLIEMSRTVIQTVQGLGSGADVAGSVLGGVVVYRKDPLLAERLLESIPLTVIYSGHKTSTIEAVNRVHQSFANDPQRFQTICNEINESVLSSIPFVKEKNWPALGQLMNKQQQSMNALGVNTSALTEIIDYLRQQPGIEGAKISGSGLGDCAIGLGRLDAPFAFSDNNIKLLRVNTSSVGVVCEKI